MHDTGTRRLPWKYMEKVASAIFLFKTNQNDSPSWCRQGTGEVDLWKWNVNNFYFLSRTNKITSIEFKYYITFAHKIDIVLILTTLNWNIWKYLMMYNFLLGVKTDKNIENLEIFIYAKFEP